MDKHRVVLGVCCGLCLALLLVTVPMILSRSPDEGLENQLGSRATEDRLVQDFLEEGHNIEVRTVVRRESGEARPEWTLKLDSLGPIYEHHKTKLLGRYRIALRDLQKKVYEPAQAGEDTQFLIRQASDMYAMWKVAAMIEAVESGQAVYTTGSTWPRLDAWDFAVSFNHNVLFNTDTGKVEPLPDWRLPDELRSTSNKRSEGTVRKRKLNIIIAIDLSKHPEITEALAYQRDLRRLVRVEGIKEFNAKPYAERKRLYLAAQAAAKELEEIHAAVARGEQKSTQAIQRRKLELYRIKAAGAFRLDPDGRFLAQPPKERAR